MFFLDLLVSTGGEGIIWISMTDSYVVSFFVSFTRTKDL